MGSLVLGPWLVLGSWLVFGSWLVIGSWFLAGYWLLVFDDVGFLLELDDFLLLSSSAFLEFLLAGFLLHCEL